MSLIGDNLSIAADALRAPNQPCCGLYTVKMKGSLGDTQVCAQCGIAVSRGSGMHTQPCQGQAECWQGGRREFSGEGCLEGMCGDGFLITVTLGANFESFQAAR